MTRTAKVVTLLLFVLFLLAHVVGFGTVQDLRRERDLQFNSPNSHLPPEFIKILAGEFKGLAADFLLLEVGSFLGSGQKATQEDWYSIYRTLRQSLILDPYFQQTYLFAQGSLPWRGELVNETNELMVVSKAHRPFDWRPDYYRGFNYYYFLGDYAEASKALLDAAKIKDSPVLVAVLGARLALKADRTKAAILLLQDMLNDKSLEEHKRKEIEDRLVALKGVLLLELALDSYQKQFYGLPLTLDELLEKGILKAMPHNPYADDYLYDPQTGKVTFDKVKPGAAK